MGVDRSSSKSVQLKDFNLFSGVSWAWALAHPDG